MLPEPRDPPRKDQQSRKRSTLRFAASAAAGRCGARRWGWTNATRGFGSEVGRGHREGCIRAGSPHTRVPLRAVERWGAGTGTSLLVAKATSGGVSGLTGTSSRSQQTEPLLISGPFTPSARHRPAVGRSARLALDPHRPLHTSLGQPRPTRSSADHSGATGASDQIGWGHAETSGGSVGVSRDRL